MHSDFGLAIQARFDPLGFQYGADMFGPEPELRSLDAIRPSLLDANCDGPDPVYAIAMDVGRPRHRDRMIKQNLLFGVVAYAAGRLGAEPVRSQGHVHKVSRNSGYSAPEIFEIWSGRALIYMQPYVAKDPGPCCAIEARPGERVVVPPSWAHAVISADPQRPLVFGAWCDRDYGFIYDGVRAHGGLAWFPILNDHGEIHWVPNPTYRDRQFDVRPARNYAELSLDPEIPLYEHIEKCPAGIQWLSQPRLKRDVWTDFEP